MFRTLIGATIAASAAGKVQWEASNNVAVGRRLGIELTSSTANVTDPDCIVGGFDSENPTRIYVGGPCKDLNIEANDGTITKVTPAATFRWIEMQTLHMEITGPDLAEPAPFAPTTVANGAAWDSGFYIATDHGGYAMVECGSAFHLNVPKEAGVGTAGLFASTTSYLARENFEFNQNEFCVDAVRRTDDGRYFKFKDDGSGATCKTKFLQCVAPCCADPGASECSCSNTCPTQQLQASPGMYKYSIMAASYNNHVNPLNVKDVFKGGAGGNGWEKLTEHFGKSPGIGKPKQLTGFMDVYQVLDFTNMNIDVLEVVAPDGTSKLWKDMVDCDLTYDYLKKNGYDCLAKEVGVKSMKVSTDGEWSAHYAFPTTQNVGVWSHTKNEEFTLTPSATRTVQISAVKPSGGTLAEWNWAKDVLEAARKKALLIRYRFDIAGIAAIGQGDNSEGRYMNYDPTVTGPSGANAPTPAPAGGAAGGAGSDGGSNSTGATGGAAAAGAAELEGATEASGAMTYSLAAVALTLAAKMF